MLGRGTLWCRVESKFQPFSDLWLKTTVTCYALLSKLYMKEKPTVDAILRHFNGLKGIKSRLVYETG